ARKSKRSSALPTCYEEIMTEPQRPSLLARQMAIITEGDQSHAATVAERRRIDALRLPPLTVPTRLETRRRSWPLTTVLMALAATVVAALWTHKPVSERESLRVKGESQVWVYWERDGEVRAFEAGASLANGDRIRAEVMAPGAAFAYWVVTSADGRILSSAAD